MADLSEQTEARAPRTRRRKSVARAVSCGPGTSATWKRGPVTIATLVIIAVISVFHHDFFSASQIADVVEQNAFVAILACGMAFLIAMRELDLSVGSILGLTVISAALLQQDGVNPWLTAVIALGIGAVLGTVNALFVQGIGIPAIIATLATQSMYRGLADALSGGQQITSMQGGQLVLHRHRRVGARRPDRDPGA